MKYYKYILVLLMPIFFSCKKEAPSATGDLSLNIGYEMTGVTQAGYTYSVSRLEYFISNIELVKKDGKAVYLPGIYYLNYQDSATSLISIAGVPEGEYDVLKFNIGLDPENNKSGALPNTLENANMAWPDPMGGGYHFLKLEGRYDSDFLNTEQGFAIHLGKNGHLVSVATDVAVSVKGKQDLRLVMDVDEWFGNPNKIDFEQDGRYSMSSDDLMLRIAQNGASVFTVKE